VIRAPAYLLLALCAPCAAQTLTVTPSTTDGTQSTLVQWTVPGATACNASGPWTGPRTPSGTNAYAPKATSEFALTCDQPGTLPVSWERSPDDDGSVSYHVYAGATAASMTMRATVTGLSTTLTDLPPGTLYVGVTAFKPDEESAMSPTASAPVTKGSITLKALLTVIQKLRPPPVVVLGKKP
jgi:hypothetical protein